MAKSGKQSSNTKTSRKKNASGHRHDEDEEQLVVHVPNLPPSPRTEKEAFQQPVDLFVDGSRQGDFRPFLEQVHAPHYHQRVLDIFQGYSNLVATTQHIYSTPYDDNENENSEKKKQHYDNSICQGLAPILSHNTVLKKLQFGIIHNMGDGDQHQLQ
jgi:hypothetical protein